MTEQHIRVGRTARYCTLGPADGTAAEIWLACHGYAQLARYFIRAFAAIDDGTRLIVAPEALNRYYHETAPGVHAHDARVAATWMTREDRANEISDYVAYLDTLAAHVLAGHHDVRLVALGFSQGAATVSRWAALGQTRLQHVVLWGGGTAHDLELHAASFHGARLTLAAGMQDRHIGEARVAEERARLQQAGLEHALFRYEGGHSIDEAALRQLASRIRD